MQKRTYLIGLKLDKKASRKFDKIMPKIDFDKLQICLNLRLPTGIYF